MSETNGNGLGELAAALAKAQAAFPKVLKDREAKIESAKGKYSYKYSDLASLFDAVRKPLADNGLALTQPIEITPTGMVLHTMLLHVSGAHLDSYYPLASHDRPQEMGSEITYSRRYTAGAILGIASEEDDDGAAAQQSGPQRRWENPGPKITAKVEDIGNPNRKPEPSTEEVPFGYEPPKEPKKPVEPQQMAEGELRKALLLKAKKVADAIGLSKEDRATAFETYCGRSSEKNVDPAALSDLVKWLETRAAAKGVTVA